MKQFFKAHAIWIGLLAVLLGCMLCPSQADAKTKTYQTQDNYYGGGSCSVVISKNKVYYSITETVDYTIAMSKSDRLICKENAVLILNSFLTDVGSSIRSHLLPPV